MNSNFTHPSVGYNRKVLGFNDVAISCCDFQIFPYQGVQLIGKAIKHAHVLVENDFSTARWLYCLRITSLVHIVKKTVPLVGILNGPQTVIVKKEKCIDMYNNDPHLNGNKNKHVYWGRDRSS